MKELLSDNDKSDVIRWQVEKTSSILRHSKTKTVILAAIGLLTVLAGADYIVMPGAARSLASYKLAAAFSMALMLLITRRQGKRNITLSTIVACICIISLAIETSIIQTGGAASTYLGGFFLLYIGIFGFIPFFSKTFTFLSALTIYAINLIPLVTIDQDWATRPFASHLIYLGVAAILASLYRIENDKEILMKMELQHLYSYDDLKQLKINNNCIMCRNMELAREMLLVINRNGRILGTNETARTFYGIPNKITDIQIDAFEADYTGVLRRLRNAASPGESITFQQIHYGRDRQSTNLRITLTAIGTGDDMVFILQAIESDNRYNKHDYSFTEQSSTQCAV